MLLSEIVGLAVRIEMLRLHCLGVLGMFCEVPSSLACVCVDV